MLQLVRRIGFTRSGPMLKLQLKRWSERPRTLMLMLAVMLPAAALIGFAAYHLRSLQRDKAIEAAIQRDYQQVLAIAEKRIDERAYETAEEAREGFPDTGNAAEIDSFLSAHPHIAYAFLWTGKGMFQFRSQPGRLHEAQFCSDGMTISSDIGSWIDIEAKPYISKLTKLAAREGRHVYITDHWLSRGDKMQYLSLVLFLPPGSTPEHPALAGFLYDTDYLKNEFFPQALNEVLPMESEGDTSHPQTAFMVRTEKDQYPMAASTYWDGGPSEVEHPFEDVFPGTDFRNQITGDYDCEHRRPLPADRLPHPRRTFAVDGRGDDIDLSQCCRELGLAKLKSDFVSNVSHELRTPLALIRLYAETLELDRVSNPGKRQEYYEIIRKESERLTSLINNILDFSRIESGKKEYSFRETDVADLVRSTLESYRFEIEQNGFEFEQKIDTELPPLWVDREAIARSLLNLVNNAVKYSATEKKYLGVNLYRHNGGVNLEVVDHGIGISEKEQPKIFEKFYRVGRPACA